MAVQKSAKGRESDDSIRAVKARLAADPTHLGHLESLARLQWAAGDCSSVLDTLRRLSSINPFEPGYHHLRGCALQCLGCYAEALEAFERCAATATEHLASEASASADALRAWPSELMARLVGADPGLRAAYERDPEETCRSLGLQGPSLAASEPNAAAFAVHTPSAWQRPS